MNLLHEYQSVYKGITFSVMMADPLASKQLPGLMSSESSRLHSEVKQPISFHDKKNIFFCLQWLFLSTDGAPINQSNQKQIWERRFCNPTGIITVRHSK